jgi:lipoprotein-anchoring transpeptidase ErfK/SrfK
MSHNIITKNFKILTFLFILSSCSSLQDINKMNKNSTIVELESIDSSYKSLENLIYVDINSQTLSYIVKGTVSMKYNISSSYYGTGSEANSLKTPLGKHEIYKKIGNELPINAILKGRVWNGAIADIIEGPIDTDYDHVTSRILWLDGLEEGKNKGNGVDSRNRYIYIHGTAEEGLIGKPASDGCIRMYNNEVIELFELVSEKTQVWIY